MTAGSMSRFSDVSFCIIDLLCQCCTSASHFFHPSLISRKRGKKHHSKPANFQTFSEVMLCVRIYYNIYIYTALYVFHCVTIGLKGLNISHLTLCLCDPYLFCLTSGHLPSRAHSPRSVTRRIPSRMA